MKKYNNDIYSMYEEQYNKNIKLSKENKKLKFEISNTKYELDYLKKSTQNKIQKEVNKATTPLINDIDMLQEELENAYKEINRLKNQIKEQQIVNDDKNYVIDKLQNRVNKNSTNSSIPTSKEIINKKTGVNTYNHRTTTNRKSCGRYEEIT